MPKAVNVGFYQNGDFDDWYKEAIKGNPSIAMIDQKLLKECFVAGWSKGWELCVDKSSEYYPD